MEAEVSEMAVSLVIGIIRYTGEGQLEERYARI